MICAVIFTPCSPAFVFSLSLSLSLSLPEFSGDVCRETVGLEWRWGPGPSRDALQPRLQLQYQSARSGCHRPIGEHLSLTAMFDCNRTLLVFLSGSIYMSHTQEIKIFLFVTLQHIIMCTDSLSIHQVCL